MLYIHVFKTYIVGSTTSKSILKGFVWVIAVTMYKLIHFYPYVFLSIMIECVNDILIKIKTSVKYVTKKTLYKRTR